MTARAGMTTMIQRLRSMTNTTPTDMTLNGVTYWSDDHLQTELDGQRTTWLQVPLIPRPEVVNGATVTKQYDMPPYIGEPVEESGTDSGFAVRDGSGVDLTGYTVNYAARTITFSADQGGKTVYLNCRTYDLNRVASVIWRRKAAFVYANVDWSSDNHALNTSQEYAHCLEMAVHYALLAGVRVVPMLRTDQIGDGVLP
jgi:hypothetical protein